jgi:hypothetical protein
MMRTGCIAFALLLLAVGLPAAGQQTSRSSAAVQPGRGVTVVRQFFEHTRYGNPDVEQLRAETVVGYGLSGDWTVMGHLPVVYRNFTDLPAGAAAPEDDAAVGFEDPRVMVQHRFWQRDTGPIDTQRAVVFGGVELPSGDDGFTSDSFDGYFGAAYTRIAGRHGMNASVLYKWNTGDRGNPVMFGDQDADAVRGDLGYLWRLSPERYTAQTYGSSYASIELLGRYETNGDTELLLAPGLMYEAARWVLSGSVAVPVAQDLDGRPETRASVMLEFRLLF